MEKSRMIRGTSKSARFFLTDTTELVKEAHKLQKLDPIAVTLFGKLLTVTAMMGQDLKSEKDVLTVRFNGDGAYGILLATAKSDGSVKGYIRNTEKKIDINKKDSLGNTDFIGDGTLQVIKDMGLKDPFVGLTKISSSDIADNIAHYFFTSDQVKSVVSLGVKVNEKGEVEQSGGFIIQLLPGVEDDFIDKIEKKIKSIKSVTDLLDGGFDLERILKLLYEDMEDEEGNQLIEEYSILEESEIEYKCDCSRERFLTGLLTLGKTEINELLEEHGEIEVECHFCMKKYVYKNDDFNNYL